MPNHNNEVSVKKAEWSKPQLVELDSNLSDIENGFAPGVDGAGGASTSLS
ncbi:hypothetical protein [Erythrobacter sp. F6033]|nr:hypothetical protein [Erythrobacter sp. F6033]MCK0127767.1 hypothetical protein [Erythrobacter sp. F6033]